MARRPMPRQVFRPPLWMTLLTAGSGLFMLALTAAAAVGFAVTGESGLDVAALVMLPLDLIAVVVLARSLRRVVLTTDHIELGWPLIGRKVRLDDIERVEHRDGMVIHTRTGLVRCRFVHRDAQVAVVAALRERLPDGGRGAPPSLPIEWRPRWSNLSTNIVMTVLFGPGMGLFGVGILGLGVQAALRQEWGEAIGAALGGVATVLVALGLTAMFLWSFRWRVVFGEDVVVETFPVRSKRRDAARIEDICVAGETRVMKGVPRQAWWLSVRFSGDDELRLEPTENGVAAEFSPEADKLELDELAHHLRRLYGLEGRAVRALLAGVAGRDLGPGFEALRDKLVATADLAGVLAVARKTTDPDLLDLLVTVSVDLGSAAARDDWLRWLRHDDERVRWTAALGLDGLAGGRFDVAQMIQGGWVQHDRVAEVVPALERWFQAP